MDVRPPRSFRDLGDEHRRPSIVFQPTRLGVRRAVTVDGRRSTSGSSSAGSAAPRSPRGGFNRLGAASYTRPGHPALEEDVTDYFQDYITVAVFAGFGMVLVAVALGASAMLRPKNPSATKRQTYECGVDPVGEGWSQTQIRYYIFALLFLIFDIEAVFIFPWAIRLESLGTFALVEMLIFVGILLAGLVYAIRKGVVKWES
jgi:NADH-quinone oxidoreductase subunit A